MQGSGVRQIVDPDRNEAGQVVIGAVMEVVMDDHAGAQMPFLGAERHTGDRSRQVNRDRRGNSSVGGSEWRAARRLNSDRRAGKGGRRAGDGVEAERREWGGCTRVKVDTEPPVVVAAELAAPSAGEPTGRGGPSSTTARSSGGNRRAGRSGDGRLPEYLTPAQVAAKLQLPEKRVVQLLRDHRIPGAGARAGASAWPRAPRREPRNRERKAVSAPGYISRSELCRRLGISRATSYRLERDGLLPRPVRIGPRTTRWPVSELDVFERRLAEDRGAANVYASEAKSASAD